ARPPRLASPDASVAEAVRRFTNLGLVEPQAAPEPPADPAPEPTAQPAPVEIDVGEALSRELTAVVAAPEGPSLWLVDDTAPNRRRQLRPGEVYRDGWVVRAIDPQYVELGRRKERRRISIYEAAPSAFAAAPAPGTAPSPQIVIHPPSDRLFVGRRK
ncbi:hypothetical protein G3573_19045, partial [Caulobacter sp. 17J65-9]|nr:hypothetical protein [Caulobacter sp. 17J65-9]